MWVTIDSYVTSAEAGDRAFSGVSDEKKELVLGIAEVRGCLFDNFAGGRHG